MNSEMIVERIECPFRLWTVVDCSGETDFTDFCHLY